MRLRRSRDFSLAVRRGKRSTRPTLVAYLWQPGLAAPAEPRSGLAANGVRDEVPARVGIVVGAAVGGAVTRNQVKRRLRQLMQSRVDRLACGSLCVIRALPAAAVADYHQLARDLDLALRTPRPDTVGDRS
jgi:ribonuclease P protein component